jgi:hypothetical protein
MSLAARLMNIFVAPGDVLEEVKTNPSRPSNWIVPLVITMIMGLVYVLVVFATGNLSTHEGRSGTKIPENG